MSHRSARAPLAVLLALAAGCGGRYSTKVPDSMVRQLPYESKIDLLEAENDLFIAYDKVDEAETRTILQSPGVQFVRDDHASSVASRRARRGA